MRSIVFIYFTRFLFYASFVTVILSFFLLLSQWAKSKKHELFSFQTLWKGPFLHHNIVVVILIFFFSFLLYFDFAGLICNYTLERKSTICKEEVVVEGDNFLFLLFAPSHK